MVTMGYVWDRTVEFLGNNLAILMPVIILGLFVPTSISGSLDVLRQAGGPGLKLGLGMLSVMFAILALWVQLAITALAVDPALGKRMTGVATARLLPAIGIYLLLLAVLLLLGVPVIMLLAAGGFDFAAAQTGQMPAMPPGYGLAVVLYVFLVLAALLFVLARLMPLTGVIVGERRGAGAISRAFRLSRGLSWRLVGVVVLYGVVALVATLAAQTVFGSILGIFAGGDGPITVASAITAIVVAAVSTGLTVLAAAFAANLYVAITRTPGAVSTPASESQAVAS